MKLFHKLFGGDFAGESLTLEKITTMLKVNIKNITIEEGTYSTVLEVVNYNNIRLYQYDVHY